MVADVLSRRRRELVLHSDRRSPSVSVCDRRSPSLHVPSDSSRPLRSQPAESRAVLLPDATQHLREACLRGSRARPLRLESQTTHRICLRRRLRERTRPARRSSSSTIARRARTRSERRCLQPARARTCARSAAARGCGGITSRAKPWTRRAGPCPTCISARAAASGSTRTS